MGRSGFCWRVTTAIRKMVKCGFTKLTEVTKNFLTHWGKEAEAEEKAA